MPEIKNRKIIFLKVSLTGTGKFDYNFRVPFFVDDMIIKSWSCGGDIFSDPVICHMDGIGDLFSFEYDNSVAINHVFNVHRNMDGLNTFAITDYDGDIYTGAGAAALLACFEFIEYAR